MTAPLTPCFNGAAPARARNSLLSNQPRLPFTVLQRGRARAGAESRQAGVCPGDQPELQRGRARAGAESRWVLLKWRERKKLQRGRARAGAESSFCTLKRDRSCGFNGAAPARARNIPHLRHSLSQSELLQRGRARAGAECGERGRRGNHERPLQRGRARAGAELPSLRQTQRLSSWLQRGRARAGAESGTLVPFHQL